MAKFAEGCSGNVESYCDVEIRFCIICYMRSKVFDFIAFFDDAVIY